MKNQKKNSIIIVVKAILGIGLLFGVAMLSACSKPIQYSPAPKPTLAQIRQGYLNQLQSDGVQVILVGETYRFILLSDNLFNIDSANFTETARPVLQTLAALMNTYQKVSVRIAAYGDNQGRVSREAALTTRQAQVVAHYLWSAGIDARLAYAVGYNRQNPVDWNGSPGGRHNNRRVEVSFQFYPEYVPYA